MTQASTTSPAPAETTPNPQSTRSKLRLAAIASAGALVLSGCSGVTQFAFDGECGDIISESAFPPILIDPNFFVATNLTYTVDRGSISTQVNGGSDTIYTYAFGGILGPNDIVEPVLGQDSQVSWLPESAIPVTPPMFEDVYQGLGPDGKESKEFDYFEAGVFESFEDLLDNFAGGGGPLTSADANRAGFFDREQAELFVGPGGDPSVMFAMNHTLTSLAQVPVVVMSTCGFRLPSPDFRDSVFDWLGDFSRDLEDEVDLGNSIISGDSFFDAEFAGFSPSSATQFYPGYTPQGYSFDYLL